MHDVVSIETYCLLLSDRLHTREKLNHGFAEDIILVASDHVTGAGDVCVLSVWNCVEKLFDRCIADDIAELTAHK